MHDVRDPVEQYLQRNVAMEVSVEGAVDLSHAAGADEGDDLVRAKASAAGKGHLGVAGASHLDAPGRGTEWRSVLPTACRRPPQT